MKETNLHSQEKLYFDLFASNSELTATRKMASAHIYLPPPKTIGDRCMPVFSISHATIFFGIGLCSM